MTLISLKRINNNRSNNNNNNSSHNKEMIHNRIKDRVKNNSKIDIEISQ